MVWHVLLAILQLAGSFSEMQLLRDNHLLFILLFTIAPICFHQWWSVSLYYSCSSINNHEPSCLPYKTFRPQLDCCCGLFIYKIKMTRSFHRLNSNFHFLIYNLSIVPKEWMFSIKRSSNHSRKMITKSCRHSFSLIY